MFRHIDFARFLSANKIIGTAPILFGTEFDKVVQQIRHREIIVLIGNENTR
jgi:hypothetical protein